jgi:hypothetical protein
MPNRTTDGEIYLLLRIKNISPDHRSVEDLYQAARGWWVMSDAKAKLVTKVFPVVLGTIRTAFVPTTWSHSDHPGEEHRIGFEGVLAEDASAWNGVDVREMFKRGSANPVLYVNAEEFRARFPRDRRDGVNEETAPASATEPTLEESIEPLLKQLDRDLLWSMSRAAQELFHSNTLAFLMEHYPEEALPIRRLFDPDASGTLRVHRELRNLDLVGEGPASRFVVENKLYSLPYPKQLRRYLEKELPWSKGHGPKGANDTTYSLLTLMEPVFDPSPWSRVTYEDLANALNSLNSADFGRDSDLVTRYRALVRRLIDLKDIVDPRSHLDEPFDVSHLLGKMHLKWFDGPFSACGIQGSVKPFTARVLTVRANSASV